MLRFFKERSPNVCNTGTSGELSENFRRAFLFARISVLNEPQENRKLTLRGAFRVGWGGALFKNQIWNQILWNFQAS